MTRLPVTRVLRPVANRQLDIVFMDVGESSRLDILFHVRWHVCDSTGVVGCVTDDWAELAEHGALWELVAANRPNIKSHVDVLYLSSWLKVARRC